MTRFHLDLTPEQRAEADRILLANSRRRSIGRNLGKMGACWEGKTAIPDAPDEFADSIRELSRL
jgi:hypothetical protein